MRITDLPIDWRQRLTPARFRDALFHVEVGGQASGRRVALHEFPKRNTPYAEDMGRRARRYTVQGYIIISPTDTDYIPARDALITALEADGPGELKLPTMEPVVVMCDQYRVDETRERGGIAVFDMLFIERGRPISFDIYPDTRMGLGQAGDELSQSTRYWIDLMMSDPRVHGPSGSMVIEAVTAFRNTFGI